MENDKEETSAAFSKPAASGPGLKAGAVIDGKFELIAEIGRGAYGVIFKARHLTLDQIVAVKFIEHHFVDSAVSLQRFHNEAKVLSTFDHPNIVHFLTYSSNQNGAQYIMMEYLSGISLEEYLKAHTIDQKFLILVMKQVLAALSYAHEKGIIHRDIKPANIFLLNTEGNPLVKLIDFGIFKIENDSAGGLTKTGVAIGSANYMSPEQCRAQSLDRRSDIYSVGCVMYECVVGTPPMAAENDLLVMTNHLNKEVSQVPSKIPISKGLTAAILKCLQKAPGNRFASAEDLSNVLVEELDAETVRGSNKDKSALLIVSLSLVVLVLGVGFAFSSRSPLHSLAEVGKNKAVVIQERLSVNRFPDPLYPPANAISKLSDWLQFALNDKNASTARISSCMARLRENYCKMLDENAKIPLEDRAIKRLEQECNRDRLARNTEPASRLDLKEHQERLRDLCVAQRAANRITDAEETLAQARALRNRSVQDTNISFVDLLCDLAKIESDESNYDKAEKYIQEAVKLGEYGRPGDLLLKLALQYQQDGKFSEAVKSLNEGFECYQRNMYPGYCDGSILVLMGTGLELNQPGSVLRFIEKNYSSASQLKPLEENGDSEAVLQNRGAAYIQLNRPDEALGAYRQMREIAKKHKRKEREVDALKQIIKLQTKWQRDSSKEIKELLSLVSANEEEHLATLNYLDATYNKPKITLPALRQELDSSAEKIKTRFPSLYLALLSNFYERAAVKREFRVAAQIQEEREKFVYKNGDSEPNLELNYGSYLALLNCYGLVHDEKKLDDTYARMMRLRGLSPVLDFVCVFYYGNYMARINYAKGIGVLEKLLADIDSKSIRNLPDYCTVVESICHLYRGKDTEKIKPLVERAMEKVKHDRPGAVAEQIRLLVLLKEICSREDTAAREKIDAQLKDLELLKSQYIASVY